MKVFLSELFICKGNVYTDCSLNDYSYANSANLLNFKYLLHILKVEIVK